MKHTMYVRCRDGRGLAALGEVVSAAAHRGELTSFDMTFDCDCYPHEPIALGMRLTFEPAERHMMPEQKFDEKREAMAVARRAALEEAAKLADEFADNMMGTAQWTAGRIAKEIRRLAGTACTCGATGERQHGLDCPLSPTACTCKSLGFGLDGRGPVHGAGCPRFEPSRKFDGRCTCSSVAHYGGVAHHQAGCPLHPDAAQCTCSLSCPGPMHAQGCPKARPLP
jgi:hypothetical protein